MGKLVAAIFVSAVVTAGTLAVISRIPKFGDFVLNK
jgi:hypothetical protein